MMVDTGSTAGSDLFITFYQPVVLPLLQRLYILAIPLFAALKIVSFVF